MTDKFQGWLNYHGLKPLSKERIAFMEHHSGMKADTEEVLKFLTFMNKFWDPEDWQFPKQKEEVL